LARIIILGKFPIASVFHILHNVESRETAEVWKVQYATAPVRVRTIVKLLRRDTPDWIIAPNMWLLNISDFSSVDYRILAMLQEWICQHPVRHVDKLRQRLIDRQTVIDQAIDRWWLIGGMSYGQTRTVWTFDVAQCFTTALHRWSIVFILYVMLHSNVGDDNDDVYTYVT